MHYLAAMYLRLSRDDCDIGNVTDQDGTVKSESNSIRSQRELIRSFIHRQQDIELYDVYVDDGYSGSNFDRPEFKRMIGDIEAGKVNCVIVKDLSRFGRDYIESGRYIQKIFPTLSVRFIALTDNYDSISTDLGESSIILPVKNFINDSYCRDISIKVKSQFEVKRKNGECIAPFAVYGYKKDEENKNHLIVDNYAADVVKKIFIWKLEGMAISAIAERLNGLGILSPKEYKKIQGNYRGGFSGGTTSIWSSTTVKRILTNEVYMGHLVQGKTERINYKIKKSVEKPRKEWIKVENTHEEIISPDTFYIVQNLLKTDSRISPVRKENSFFAGMLFCGDCKEQMIRRINKYKNKEKIYYICSTKNRGEGCSRHSLKEDKLKVLVTEIVIRYVNAFLEGKTLFDKAEPIELKQDSMVYYHREIERLEQQRDKYNRLYLSLDENLKTGILTKDEFTRLSKQFRQKTAELTEALRRQELMKKDMLIKEMISYKKLENMQSTAELREIDRYILSILIKKIYVYEGKRMEIIFYFCDPYRSVLEGNRKRKD